MHHLLNLGWYRAMIKALYGTPYSKNSCKYALADCDGLTGGKQCDFVRICILGYKRGNGFCKACTSGFFLLGICTGIFPPWNLLGSDAWRKENAKTDKSSFQIHIAVCALALCRLWCLCLSKKAVCFLYVFTGSICIFRLWGIGGAVFCGLSFSDVPVCSNSALCISLHELPEPKKKIKNTLSEIGMCLTEQKK